MIFTISEVEFLKEAKRVFDRLRHNLANIFPVNSHIETCFLESVSSTRSTYLLSGKTANSFNISIVSMVGLLISPFKVWGKSLIFCLMNFPILVMGYIRNFKSPRYTIEDFFSFTLWEF